MSTWPKKPRQLTPEQERVREDFVRHWHTVLPRQFSVVERFNHGYAAARARPGTTVEIGAGLGEHIRYEDLTSQHYTAIELREEMAVAITRDFPAVRAMVADCQTRLPIDSDSVDRVIAIHVLVHLPDLPAALAEVHRILRSDGSFQVCIPCEGGFAYALGRRLSAERIFRKRYNMDYRWFVESEHINLPSEILLELDRLFFVRDRTYFPLRVPIVSANLVIGLDLTPR